MANAKSRNPVAERKAVLAKREKNRNGCDPYKLSKAQQKVEDECNKTLRELNTEIQEAEAAAKEVEAEATAEEAAAADKAAADKAAADKAAADKAAAKKGKGSPLG